VIKMNVVASQTAVPVQYKNTCRCVNVSANKEPDL